MEQEQQPQEQNQDIIDVLFEIQFPGEPRPPGIQEVLNEWEEIPSSARNKIAEEIGMYYKFLYLAQGGNFELPPKPKSLDGLSPRLQQLIHRCIPRDYKLHYYMQGFNMLNDEEKNKIIEERKRMVSEEALYGHLPKEGASLGDKHVTYEQMKEMVDMGLLAPNKPKKPITPNVDLSKSVLAFNSKRSIFNQN